jgi:prepilin-type N-terminal cleavage/methylation domain-containing protein/prepilin-type processing-associated H-X9-DG protein
MAIASSGRAERRGNRGAFTLVELLVVIGIIAVLISILLPTLASARRAANAVKCGSALKELGNAFKLYSIDYKNAYPVVKWDIPVANQSSYPELAPGPTSAGYFLYWQDFLAKYISKNMPEMGAAKTAGRPGIFWGCPEWQGRFGGFADPSGISVYENGYAMNHYPNWQPETPLGTEPPKSGQACDSTSQGIKGKWPRLTDYSAERCLVTETNLWLGLAVGTNASHTIAPECNCSSPGFNGFLTGALPAGYNSIDRYRHGTYPHLNAGGLTFDDKGGQKVKYNMLFGDGHVSMLTSIGEGVRAIQMRDP